MQLFCVASGKIVVSILIVLKNVEGSALSQNGTAAARFSDEQMPMPLADGNGRAVVLS
jgi:hypothetical protein